MLNGAVSPAEGPPPSRRSAASWADGGWRQRKGRGEPDPVYNHAEVYGNKAELATAGVTCWGGRLRGSSARPVEARVAGGLGTLPTTCPQSKKKKEKIISTAAAVVCVNSFTHDFNAAFPVNCV